MTVGRASLPTGGAMMTREREGAQPDAAKGEPTLIAARPAPSRLLASQHPWLTPAEAADHLGLASVRALYQRVRRGQIRAHRLGGRLRFRLEDLDRACSPAWPE
jgi:excisionase family DNA binding protein